MSVLYTLLLIAAVLLASTLAVLAFARLVARAFGLPWR
jgi:hypothetical protein